MNDAEVNDLGEDMLIHGQREPIWLFEGMILDGRNRYNACLSKDIEPRILGYRGSDALAFVISLNLKRRHLDESQRAMVGAKLATLAKGRPADTPQICGVSTDKASKLLNVGTRSIESAKSLRRDGVPDLVNAVDRGDVSVSSAATFAKANPPLDQQRLIVEHGSPAAAVKAKADRAATKPTKPVADVVTAADRAAAKSKPSDKVSTEAVAPSDDRKAALGLAVVNENVVTLAVKDDGSVIEEKNSFGDAHTVIDIADHSVGAHGIYGAMGIIDLAQTTPEAFWAIFGTSGRKPGAIELLDSTIRKLAEIRAGQPHAPAP